MKTAISVPDEVFSQAEQIAKERGISRSELYTEALKRLLEEELVRKLNQVYAEVDSEPDPALEAYSVKQLRKVEW
jgi:metal-responsive CopG/Arc/MetJ family transcriptional regulator